MSVLFYFCLRRHRWYYQHSVQIFSKNRDLLPQASTPVLRKLSRIQCHITIQCYFLILYEIFYFLIFLLRFRKASKCIFVFRCQIFCYCLIVESIISTSSSIVIGCSIFLSLYQKKIRAVIHSSVVQFPSFWKRICTLIK